MLHNVSKLLHIVLEIVFRTPCPSLHGTCKMHVWCEDQRLKRMGSDAPSTLSLFAGEPHGEPQYSEPETLVDAAPVVHIEDDQDGMQAQAPVAQETSRAADEDVEHFMFACATCIVFSSGAVWRCVTLQACVSF